MLFAIEYWSHTVALSKLGRHRIIYTGGCETVCSVGVHIRRGIKWNKNDVLR
jgi:hypothetical protein